MSNTALPAAKAVIAEVVLALDQYTAVFDATSGELIEGDAIYTGTPGATRKMKPGDVVEVEIERIGVLRNQVAAA